MSQAPVSMVPRSEEPDVAPPVVEATSKASKGAALVVALSVAGIVGLSLWYLVQPQPLLVQGEADATRVDIAARVDGRVGERPVSRGNNVTIWTGPCRQLTTRNCWPSSARRRRQWRLRRPIWLRVDVGTRAEVIAEREAAVAAAEASVNTCTTDLRPREEDHPGRVRVVARLDEATASLDVGKRNPRTSKACLSRGCCGLYQKRNAALRKLLSQRRRLPSKRCRRRSTR